jgi:DNA-binding NtrC family response regulator
VRGLSPEVAETFRQYSWPGNVRELRNVIERVMILEEGDLITTKYLPRGFAMNGADADQVSATKSANFDARHAKNASSQPSNILFRLPPEGVILDDVEMSLVRQALEHSHGNQTRAAELLGISRDQLRYRLKKLEDEAAE